MPKKKIKEDEVIEMLKNLKTHLDHLTAEVQTLKENKEVKQETKPEVIKSEPINEPPVQTTEQKFPVPQEYREIVDQTLNRHFGIEIKAFSDQPAFMFTIVVPKKYSNMTEEEWKMKGADLRSRVVNYAEGANGVKLWADQVFNNFVSELKAQIIADRI